MRGRLEVIKKGPLKTIAPSSTIICDIAHNPTAGLSTNKYLSSLDKKENNKYFLSFFFGMQKTFQIRYFLTSNLNHHLT